MGYAARQGRALSANRSAISRMRKAQGGMRTLGGPRWESRRDAPAPARPRSRVASSAGQAFRDHTLMRPAPARTETFDDLPGFLRRLLEHLAEPVQPGGAGDPRQLLRVVGDEFRRFPVGH